MKRLLQRAAIISSVILSSGALAQTFESEQQATPLLELYTSEGCSSCPPADTWLASLRDSPRLWRDFVPVAFHVDYWNYLGWKDRFSSESFARRQRLYRQQGYTQGVYTPGVMLGGLEWRSWRRARTIPTVDGVAPGALRLDINDDRFAARFDASTILDGKATRLHVAVLGAGLETDVRAGENRGRTLSHDFVVLGYKHYDAANHAWDAKLPSITHRSDADRLAVAAWVSRGDDLVPVQAVGGWLTAAR